MALHATQLEALFSSRVRVKLLQLFATSPDKKYHSRELARVTGERQNAIWRELRNLQEAGLLHSEIHGKRKEYAIAQGSPLYADLRRLVLRAQGLSSAKAEAGQSRRTQPEMTPDIHERYRMPNAGIACRPSYIVGVND